jgi:hypothetical protein
MVLNFKCPYQANVMKMFDKIKRRMVKEPFIDERGCGEL